MFREDLNQILKVLELLKTALGEIEDEERNQAGEGSDQVRGQLVGVVHVIQTWDVHYVYLLSYQVVPCRVSRQDNLYLFEVHKILPCILLDNFDNFFPAAVFHPLSLPPALEHLLNGIPLAVADQISPEAGRLPVNARV